MRCGRRDDRHLDVFGDFRVERMCSCFLAKLGVVTEEPPEPPSSHQYTECIATHSTVPSERNPEAS